MSNSNPEEKTTEDSQKKMSLEDQVLKYDMKAMVEDLQTEFDAGVYSQELVSQNDIGLLFNLKQKKLDIHARN